MHKHVTPQQLVLKIDKLCESFVMASKDKVKIFTMGI